MRFQHRIALKPAKTYFTHDFTIIKQYEDKTKRAKYHEQFLDVPPGTVKISCIQKGNPWQKVLLCIKMQIFDKATVFHVFAKN